MERAKPINVRETVNKIQRGLILTSGDNIVESVGIKDTTDWNLLKTILKASNSTFFKISSARTATWKDNKL